jgi:hypothetical protein
VMFECDVMSCIPPISRHGAVRYGTNLRYIQQGMIAHITATVMTKRRDGTALCSGRDLNVCTYYSQCRTHRSNHDISRDTAASASELVCRTLSYNFISMTSDRFRLLSAKELHLPSNTRYNNLANLENLANLDIVIRRQPCSLGDPS